MFVCLFVFPNNMQPHRTRNGPVSSCEVPGYVRFEQEGPAGRCIHTRGSAHTVGYLDLCVSPAPRGKILL